MKKNSKRKRVHQTYDLQQFRIPVQPVQDLFQNVCQFFQFQKQWK